MHSIALQAPGLWVLAFQASDFFRHFEVRAFIDIEVAHARPSLNHWNFRLFDDHVNQFCAASRECDIDFADSGENFLDFIVAFAGGKLNRARYAESLCLFAF